MAKSKIICKDRPTVYAKFNHPQSQDCIEYKSIMAIFTFPWRWAKIARMVEGQPSLPGKWALVDQLFTNRWE